MTDGNSETAVIAVIAVIAVTAVTAVTASTPPLLELRGIAKQYSRVSKLRALGRVAQRAPRMALAPTDIEVPAGSALGLVGESGSGKTTLARIAAGLLRPCRGEVCWQGTPIDALDKAARAAWRREVQYVFQHPNAALNPRHRVRQILAGALAGLWRGAHDLSGSPGSPGSPVSPGSPGSSRSPRSPGTFRSPGSRIASRTHEQAERQARIAEVCEQVGVSRALLELYPHQLSGGQAQRVCIARSLLGAPKLLILDEPVSALDLSLQAQILNLLAELRRELGLTYLFITHDLALVERLCPQTCVMQAGAIVERGETSQILSQPRQPYTRRLLQAVPRLNNDAHHRAPASIIREDAGSQEDAGLPEHAGLPFIRRPS